MLFNKQVYVILNEETSDFIILRSFSEAWPGGNQESVFICLALITHRPSRFGPWTSDFMALVVCL